MKILCLITCCFLIVSGLLTGCKPMPNDGIPFYLRIDSVQLETLDSQGVNSQNITDVWVEADNSNLGAYELPINFPVLEEGEVRFVINAGVWVNGQQANRTIYPFYSSDTFTLNALRAQNYSHTPKFKYIPAAQFSFIDDFTFGNGFAGITLESDSGKPGNGTCAAITVTVADSNKMAITIDDFDLPEGRENWVEFDYKCSVPFYVGFTSVSPDVRYNVLFVNPKSTWNKLYIKLTDGVDYIRADSYRIFFEALRPQNSTGGKVYLDNIKLVHF